MEWDGKRRRFSSVVIDDDSIRAEECKVLKATSKSSCTPCKRKKKVLQDLKTKNEKRPTSRAMRLKFSGMDKLTTPEKLEKMSNRSESLAKKNKSLAEDNRRSTKRNLRLEAELSTYKPVNPEERQVILSVGDSIRKQKQKLLNPRCKWTVGDGICGKEDLSLDQLEDHVRQQHLHPQHESMVQNGIVPEQRPYKCGWDGCSKKGPFPHYKDLCQHVIEVHVGTKEQLLKLQADMCSLNNRNRAPRARRYNAATRALCLKYYRSRGSWQRLQLVCPSSLPSLSTVLKWKNTGGIRSGVDYEIVSQLGALAAKKPELRYGTLVFDEVSK